MICKTLGKALNKSWSAVALRLSLLHVDFNKKGLIQKCQCEIHKINKQGCGHYFAEFF